MRFHRIAFVVALSVAALAVPPLTSARAETAQAAPSDNARAAAGVASVDPANSPEQKGLAGKAIDKVKEVAKTAGDILSRVPCRSPKGGARTMGSLPHVAAKLVAGKPVVIVAFGSSSTQGMAAPHRNSPIRTGWPRSCAGNIRAPTSPSSIAARAAKTRLK